MLDRNWSGVEDGSDDEFALRVKVDSPVREDLSHESQAVDSSRPSATTNSPVLIRTMSPTMTKANVLQRAAAIDTHIEVMSGGRKAEDSLLGIPFDSCLDKDAANDDDADGDSIFHLAPHEVQHAEQQQQQQQDERLLHLTTRTTLSRRAQSSDHWQRATVQRLRWRDLVWIESRAGRRVEAR